VVCAPFTVKVPKLQVVHWVSTQCMKRKRKGRENRGNVRGKKEECKRNEGEEKEREEKKEKG
jgi:hypothetical protein